MEKEAKRRLIYYLSLIGFFAIFSTTISKNPVLPLFAKALGSTDAILGLIAAFSPLAGIVFSFPLGLLSDKLDRKRLLIISAIIFSISPLLYLFVTNPWFLIPIRFFHGAGTAILGPIASAMIAEHYTKNKGEKLGVYSSATLMGRTLAPLIGGAVISYFAFFPGLWNFKAVYVIAFVISLPLFLLVLMIKEEKRLKKKRVSLKEIISNAKSFIKNKKCLATGFVELAVYFTFGVLETYLPVYLSNLKFPAYEIGLIFSIQIISIALTKPLFGKLADRVDKRYQIVVGLLILGITISSIPFFSSLITIIALSILFGLGLSFVTAATIAYIAEVSDSKKLGASMGAFSSIMDIGQTAGPLVAGIIITSFSFYLGFLSCLVLAIAASLVFIKETFRKDR